MARRWNGRLAFDGGKVSQAKRESRLSQAPCHPQFALLARALSERIANTAHGPNRIGSAIARQSLPQPAYVNVNRAGLDI